MPGGPLNQRLRLAIPLALGVALAGCATAPRPKPPARRCLTQAEVTDAEPMVDAIIDTTALANGIAAGNTVLVAKECWKRIYLRRGVRFVAFRDPTDPDADVEISTSRVDPATAGQCWHQTLELITTLDAPWAEILLAAHHALYAWQWSDPDVGPVKWLACDPSTTRGDYLESITMLLHELVHGMAQDGCLFESRTDSRICFKLDPSLPLRSLAKLDSFPTDNPEIIAALTMAQKVYLTDTDQPPLFLFDEVNAYTVTTRAWTALLKRFGPSDLFNGEHRMGLLLPLFADYATLYLERLQQRSPEVFNREFGAGTLNRTSLMALLDGADSAYDAWKAGLAEIHKAPKDVESKLWSDYQAGRARLGLAAADPSKVP